MISLLPGLPPADTTNAYKILELVTDPEASKKRLEELFAEKKAATEAAVEAAKHRDAAKKEHEAASIELATREADLNRRERECADSAAKLAGEYDKIVSLTEAHDAIKAALVKREAELNKRESEHFAKVKTAQDALSRKESDIGAREGEVASRENILGELEAKAHAMMKDAEERIGKLKALIGV